MNGHDLIRRVDHIDEFTGLREIETNAIWVASRGNFLNGGNLRFEMEQRVLRSFDLTRNLLPLKLILYNFSHLKGVIECLPIQPFIEV